MDTKIINDETIQNLVEAEFKRLAELLSKASESEWDTPSLCEGWRVREVIAHLTMPARYEEKEIFAELEAHNNDFGSLSNDIAYRDAKLPINELVANLRSDKLSRWKPPGGSYHDALNHVVIHGLDVTVPLQQLSPPNRTITIALDDLTKGAVYKHFSTNISGRKLEADDMDWSYGTGTILRGKAADLALALCGRKLPAGRLKGEPL